MHLYLPEVFVTFWQLILGLLGETWIGRFQSKRASARLQSSCDHPSLSTPCEASSSSSFPLFPSSSVQWHIGVLFTEGLLALWVPILPRAVDKKEAFCFPSSFLPLFSTDEILKPLCAGLHAECSNQLFKLPFALRRTLTYTNDTKHCIVFRPSGWTSIHYL